MVYHSYSKGDIKMIIGFLAGRIPQLQNVEMPELNDAVFEAFEAIKPSIELNDFEEEKKLLLTTIEDLNKQLELYRNY